MRDCRRKLTRHTMCRWMTASTLATLVAGTWPAGLPAQQQPENGEAAQAEQPLVEIALNDARIETAVATINMQIPNTVNIFGKVAGSRVTVLADGQPVETVLGMIANPNGWIYWRDPNTGDYGLADREYYEKNILVNMRVQKVFRPNNIKASELDRAIKGLLTPNLGSSVADDRTNKLIIEDLPQVLERIETFIREIDVQLIVRVFYIRKANVEEIARKLEQYKSGPGTIEVDATTHQIIVTDLLSNIKKMELLVDILDVGPEIVQYDINNIGIAGEDLEGLQRIIESIRTKGTGVELLFEVSEKQGVMILEDVPEVHEKVEQILREFDKPVRQVLIQSEILSTSFNRSMNFGVNRFAIAEDLLQAGQQGALGPVADGIGLAGGAAAAVEPRFTDIYSIFPNASYMDGTLTGSYLSKIVWLQLQAAYNDTSTRVLLQPRVLVKNQERSNIFVGEEVPFLTTFFENTGGTAQGRTTTTQSTVNSGLGFEVTPSIANSFLIELELNITNDSARPQDVPEGGTVRRLIGRDRQNVETKLQIPSGQTRMIGGLITNSDSDGSTGLPLLSSIPYLGGLFGSKSMARRASNLMIFITPSIVEEDLPRVQEIDGRRGRSLTQYDRVPGQWELDLREPETEEVEDPFEQYEGPLLSGDPQEEDEATRLLRQAQEARRLMVDEDGLTNYQPSAGFGSATLNVPGEAAAPPQPVVQPAQPQGAQPTQPAQPPTTRPIAVSPAETGDPGIQPVPPPEPTQPTGPNETQYR